MAAETIHVKGLREARSALKRYDREVSLGTDRALRAAAQLVADDATSRFSAIDARSASGYRPRTRGFSSVVVEQRLRKTTGQHPEYGSLQMRKALLPALAENEDRVVEALDSMLTTLAFKEGF